MKSKKTVKRGNWKPFDELVGEGAWKEINQEAEILVGFVRKRNKIWKEGGDWKKFVVEGWPRTQVKLQYIRIFMKER